MDNSQRVSHVEVPEDRKKKVQEAQKTFHDMAPRDDVMTAPFTAQELEEAIKFLKKKKSPGPVTNDLMQHLGPAARVTLLKIFNESWKNSSVPQSRREKAPMIHKTGKDKSKVASCVGTLIERLINTRLVWYLEKKPTLIPQQTGFRQNRSTEEQCKSRMHSKTKNTHSQFGLTWRKHLIIKLLIPFVC